MDSRTYFKVDDHLPENPKIIRAGEEAEILYLHGLAYCSRQLTDGIIPKEIVPRLVAKGSEKRAKALLENELWFDRGDHFEVKDYLLHQRSREQIENERRKARERAAKSRRTSQGTFARTTDEVTPPEAEAVTESEAKGERDKEHLSRARGIERANWKPTPELLEWAATEYPEVDLVAETRKFIDHFAANGKPMKDWNAAWRNWIRRTREFSVAR